MVGENPERTLLVALDAWISKKVPAEHRAPLEAYIKRLIN